MDLVLGTGNLVKLLFEGNFWGIRTNEGVKYELLNPPSSFNDGQRVFFIGRAYPGQPTINMWGTPLRLWIIFSLW